MLEEALEHLVRGIVQYPDEVRVSSRMLRRGNVLEVRVHPDDLGKVIGRGGRTARALRTVIGALAAGRYVRIDLLDANEVRYPVRVIVGRIGRPHGIRGEVVIGVRTDEPDLRFAVGASLDAGPTADGDTAAGPAAPGGRGKRWHSGQLLVAFAGITDRTAAGELTGSWLSVDTSQLPPTADPDEFRDHELIGLSVRTSAGEAVGVVTDVLHHGQDLLVVRRAAARRPGAPGAVREGDRAGGGRGRRRARHRPAPRPARPRASE